MTRQHARIRTAQVLEQIPSAPASVSIASVALALSTEVERVTSGELSGHCTHLMRQGLIRRVARGVYARTEPTT